MTKLTSIWFIHRQFGVTSPLSINNITLQLEKKLVTLLDLNGYNKGGWRILDHMKLIEQIPRTRILIDGSRTGIS